MRKMTLDHNHNIKELCQVLLLLTTEREVYHFLKDLCTPAELGALAERWQICKYLDQGLSYREIHTQMGASLTTIGRVARFLNMETHQGYAVLLRKLKKNEEA